MLPDRSILLEQKLLENAKYSNATLLVIFKHCAFNFVLYRPILEEVKGTERLRDSNDIFALSKIFLLQVLWYKALILKFKRVVCHLLHCHQHDNEHLFYTDF